MSDTIQDVMDDLGFEFEQPKNKIRCCECGEGPYFTWEGKPEFTYGDECVCNLRIINRGELIDVLLSVAREKNIALQLLWTEQESREHEVPEAFLSGFVHALKYMRYLREQCQFSRSQEIENILDNFAKNILLDWLDEIPNFVSRINCNDIVGTIDDFDHPEFSHESWPSIRQRILRRDKFCKKCGDVVELQVDHIKEVWQGGLPKDDNLRVLCKGCNLSRKRILIPEKGYTEA